MRRLLTALGLAIGAAVLCIGCMDTRTASLGIEDRRVSAVVPDAASTPAKRDAGAVVAEASTLSPQSEPDQSRDDGDLDDGGGALVADAGQAEPDAGREPVSMDAGPRLPVVVDAGVSDASAAHKNDERDGAREDAKAPVNPLCIAEPWHCQ